MTKASINHVSAGGESMDVWYAPICNDAGGDLPARGGYDLRSEQCKVADCRGHDDVFIISSNPPFRCCCLPLIKPS